MRKRTEILGMTDLEALQEIINAFSYSSYDMYQHAEIIIERAQEAVDHFRGENQK